MFTITKTVKLNTAGKSIVEATCLQSDGKPKTFANGSIALEMDTGTMFMYDEQNQIWRAWS